ncbi:MAG: DUF1566 domain-containing protein, partial [Alcaligenaceae bacterium]
MPVTTVPPAVPAKPTTLSISLASLTLSANQPLRNPALTGNPRVLTITNTGAEEAVDVAITSSPPLPVGTTVSPASCATIPAAGGTCVLTVTPGSVPTAAVGDTASAPAVVTIAGSNTNTLTSQIAVLAYGSVYQAGYVFAVDDTLPISGSIGVKVAGLTNRSNAIMWSPVNSSVGATSPTDGASNSRAILAAYSASPANSYAAGLCSQPQGGYSDWYLPAMCEFAASCGNGQ